MEKIRILFVCTGASCRSQMATGFMNAIFPAAVEAFAAGSAPKGLDPMAIAAMSEAGVDISHQPSLGLEAYQGQSFDWVVTVCSGARGVCPVFPGPGRRIHMEFDDPPKLAAKARNTDEAMTFYRQVRDQIRQFVDSFPAGFEKLSDAQHGK